MRRRRSGSYLTGSGNDFVKSLGISDTIARAVDIVMRGRRRRIDAGRINDRYFVNVVGIGFDAAVNRASYTINHRKGGLARYLCALAKTIGTYDPVQMQISMNGTTADETVFLLTIGNGTTCGGGFRLTPEAKVDDGLLNVTLLWPLSLGRLLWHLPKAFRGTIGTLKRNARLDRAPKLTVEAARPVPVHVDGEVFGEGTRYEIEVIPGALTVIGN